MSADAKRRSSPRSHDKVIAFSISYQQDNMLARGMGYEHLRDLLLRLAGPILRQGSSLAYGGHWKETDENFTFDLLRLVGDEPDLDEAEVGPGRDRIRIYNHSSWPHYLGVTTNTEARWMNICRIVRVTQQDAGFAAKDVVSDADARKKDARVAFNTAVCASAMRRIMMEGTSIPIAGAQPEIVPPVAARILLGGKADGYSGFMPGIFEEALVSLEHKRPIYVLGGFGGSAEILARAILAKGDKSPAEFTLKWQRKRTAELAELLESSRQFRRPPRFRSTEALFAALFRFVRAARKNPAATLNTGLSDKETRDLLSTQNIPDAVRLVRKGLLNNALLSPLAM